MGVGLNVAKVGLSINKYLKFGEFETPMSKTKYTGFKFSVKW